MAIQETIAHMAGVDPAEVIFTDASATRYDRMKVDAEIVVDSYEKVVKIKKRLAPDNLGTQLQNAAGALPGVAAAETGFGLKIPKVRITPATTTTTTTTTTATIKLVRPML